MHLKGICQRLPQPWRDPGLSLRRIPTQVDNRNRRQFGAAMARGQMQACITTLFDIIHSLKRRRRGDQYNRNPLKARPNDRHIPRVIDDAILLLVGKVVLLIDRDEAEFPERQKQGGARADHDASSTISHGPPDPPATRPRHVRMPFLGTHAKPDLEALEKLSGQRNLRQQHEDLTPGRKRFGNRFEVYLGLAGTGYAIK